MQTPTSRVRKCTYVRTDPRYLLYGLTRAISRGRARIQARIERLAFGHSGDAKPVGEGVSELRINYGPGYRVYFKRRGQSVVLLLIGGDKGSQSRDIKTAIQLARTL